MDNFIRKFLDFEVMEVPAEEKASGDEPVIDMVFTSGAKDGSGDIIDPDGGDFKRFKKNPVILFAHNSGKYSSYPAMPIGKAKKIWQNEKKQWVSRILFDKEDEFAMKVYGKYQRGFMKASSIGFKAKEYDWIEDKDSGRITGIHFKKWELAEISLLSIGDNPEALIAAGLGKDGRDELLAKHSNSSAKTQEESMNEELVKALDALSGKIDALSTDVEKVKAFIDAQAKENQEQEKNDAVKSIVEDIQAEFKNAIDKYLPSN